jgi:gluconokinase
MIRTKGVMMVIVLMGVSGSGKTTVGQALAKLLGWRFADADDWHPEANRIKMHQGIALTDGDRHPWLCSLQTSIDKWLHSGESVVLACSALKQSYRNILRCDDARVRVVYLKGRVDIIQQRLESRENHFMPADLLSSQFDVLEEPHHGIIIDIEQPLDSIVQRIAQQLT